MMKQNTCFKRDGGSHLFSIHYFRLILKNLQEFINKLIHIDEMVFTKIVN